MGMVTYLAYDENYIVIVESQEVTETKMSPICCVTLALLHISQTSVFFKKGLAVLTITILIIVLTNSFYYYY